MDRKRIELLPPPCKGGVLPLSLAAQIFGITNFSRVSVVDTESTSLMHRIYTPAPFAGLTHLDGAIWWVLMVTLHEATSLQYNANGFTVRRRGQHPYSFWSEEWDSNPRYKSFAGSAIRPLWHPHTTICFADCTICYAHAG